jgi:hypothetical protein
MTRIAFLGSASLIFLSCAALPACGQQDETQAVLAQCGDPTPHDVDSCLERARVLEETDPTPQMQALVGKLIQIQVRASDAQPPPSGAVGDADHPSDDNGVSSYDVAPPDPPPSSDLAPLEPYQPPPDERSQDETPPDTQSPPTDMGPPDADAPPAGGTIIQTTPQPDGGSDASH